MARWLPSPVSNGRQRSAAPHPAAVITRSPPSQPAAAKAAAVPRCFYFVMFLWWEKWHAAASTGLGEIMDGEDLILG